MKLVSFIMPTRTASHQMLEKAVRSIIEHPSSNVFFYGSDENNEPDFEILLRIDDDDKARVEFVDKELRHESIRVVIGPRGRGYHDMGVFVKDLVDIADSQWCWLFDDDAWVEGDWYGPLSKIACHPIKGPAINANLYALGESVYQNGPRGEPCGIIVPTEFVKSFPYSNPVDQAWIDETRKRGWTFKQLGGVTYHHDGRPRFI